MGQAITPRSLRSFATANLVSETFDGNAGKKVSAVAGLIAVDSIEQAQIESGDLIQAFGDDTSRWVMVHEVVDIVAGKMPGRAGTDQVTLFKSHGIATWDIAAAAWVLDRAEKQGVGRHVPLGGA